MQRVDCVNNTHALVNKQVRKIAFHISRVSSKVCIYAIKHRQLGYEEVMCAIQTRESPANIHKNVSDKV